ncbi:hypothetical protein OAF98_00305 [Planctomicrobium sp.]|jgi:hypothetical protein|nr:hypothetical protein [Planctomicrobium sp.]MDB4742898.1 hypothetical protein [Planctomicrobium sp.]
MKKINNIQFYSFSLIILNTAVFCFAQDQNYNPEKKQVPKFIPALIQPELKFGNLPGHLDRASNSAFKRGLMPLESRLKYLALARDARISEAGDSESAVQDVWTGYRNELAAIVPQIRRLNQPGASGWNAELILAKYSVLRANQQIASITEDAGGLAEATAGLQEAATALYRQRETDYSAGLASLQDLMYARDRLLNSTQFSSVDRIDAIEGVILTQSKWNSKGAEIGRTDRILEAQLTKELIGFQDSLEAGALPAITEKLFNLNSTGHQHFETTLKFYQNGTAPLHQLTSSILIRQRLQRLSNEFPELQSDEADQEFQSDWNTLKSIAESTSDRRGRNEADLIAIDLMNVSVNAEAP